MRNVAISAFKALLIVGLMAWLVNVPLNAFSLIAAYIGAFLIVYGWRHE